MISAAKPAHEAERLAELQRYQILDTAPEADFDDIVELASQICGVPISLISLVDSERQWFKARHGLTVAETPRDQAFCAHAILEDGIFEVADASRDPRFADNPLVADDPHIRFYAGVPLQTPQGQAIGTLCVIDRAPRQLNEQQRFALRALSKQVVNTLELRLRLRQAEQQQARLQSDNRQIRKLLDASPVPLMMIEIDTPGRMDNGHILGINTALTELLGYTLADLPDQSSWLERAYPDPTYRQAVMQLSNGWLAHNDGAGMAQELWITGKDGRRHLCEVKRSRFENTLLLSLYDITRRKELEDALRESEENMRTVIEIAPVPLAMLQYTSQAESTHIPLLHVNQAFSELFGYTLADIPNGARMMERLYPDADYRVQVNARGQRALASAEIIDSYVRLPADWIQAKDGSRHHVERIASRFEDKLIVSFHDLTERYQMEEALRTSEANTRQYLDALPIGVSIIDENFETRYNNSKAESLLGEVRQMDLDPAYGIFVRDSDQAYPLDQLPNARALKGERIMADDIEIRLPGRITPLEAWGSPVYDAQGNITAGLAAFFDISDRLRYQHALEAAKEAAEAASQAKGEFLANMSHEIRTPMNAILGLNHLLEKTELDGKQLDYVRKIRSSAQNLLGIINDILDVSKIEAGKLELEQIDFDLDEVLSTLSNLLSLKAQQKGLALIFSLDPQLPSQLLGDPLRLEQVLINLVNNAVKFTDTGSVTVAIRLESETASEAVLHFSVCDTGIGMTAEQQKRLFQAFSQADTSITRQFGGTGLGLTIAKRLTELMHGRIGVESSAGAGSCFWFTARFGKPGTKVAKIRTEALAGIQALVVDDQAETREILGSYLREFGMEVHTCASGPEALKLLEKLPTEIQLIMLDWRLPGMDGIETLRQLRRRLPQRPAAILMTAYGREDLLQRIDTAEIDSVLFKPLMPSMVYNALIGALQLQPPSSPQPDAPTSWQDWLQPHQGARILLVEDNLINQQVAQELLEAEGLRVEIAGDGQQALDALARTAFDLVLMDLQMPVMDGYATTRQIRAQPGWRNLPIIALTADVVAGVREQVLAAGMNDCIGKPIAVGELFAALLRWLPETPPLPAAGPAAALEIPDDLRRIAGLDPSSALQRVAGNLDFYRRLLQEFVASYSDLETRYLRLEAAERYRLLHTLTGVAGTLGMEALGRQATALEAALKADPTAEPAGLTELFANTEALCRQLEALAPAAAAAPASATEAAFEQALNHFDPQALDLLAGLELDAELRASLSAALERFDFKQARELFAARAGGTP